VKIIEENKLKKLLDVPAPDLKMKIQKRVVVPKWVTETVGSSKKNIENLLKKAWINVNPDYKIFFNDTCKELDSEYDYTELRGKDREQMRQQLKSKKSVLQKNYSCFSF